MEFGLVRLFLVVALAPQQRGEGGASTSGKQLGPTDVDIHDYLNSMLKCSMKVVVRQPRYPDVATAGHARRLYGNLRLSEERDPFSVLLVTG
jgi:hypothetical protein